ncbi:MULTISPECIES: hypothetical protein [unclassified Dyella]|uniref:hypothetical protein n=1 Tax=Dyella sp. ASV21 TaxID=2795114 RepID=UPI0018EB5C53|nr:MULTISPECIES: hypothetical protein [unclassified Dyella]
MSHQSLTDALLRLFDAFGIHLDSLTVDPSRSPFRLSFTTASFSRLHLAKQLATMGCFTAVSLLRNSRVQYWCGDIEIEGVCSDAMPGHPANHPAKVEAIKAAAASIFNEAHSQAEILLHRLASHLKINRCQVARRASRDGHVIEVAYVSSLSDPLHGASSGAALQQLEALASADTVFCDMVVSVRDPLGEPLSEVRCEGLTIHLDPDSPSFRYANGLRRAAVHQAVQTAHFAHATSRAAH